MAPASATTRAAPFASGARAAAAPTTLIGSWTTRYVVGPSNYFGKNIRIPTTKINGHVVQPGAWFDFWAVIGMPTVADGYGPGGAIIGGRSNPTGALAGGICSVSTTLFNAALRAGLQMGKRSPDYYYISRYPLGLDATVSRSGTTIRQNMTFRNDTRYPILIRGINLRRSVRFELWSLGVPRRVTLTSPIVTDLVAAQDSIQYTDDLAAGVRNRTELPHDGYRVSVTRTVTGPSGGAVIHRETYLSHYKPVLGTTMVGRKRGDPLAGTIVIVPR